MASPRQLWRVRLHCVAGPRSVPLSVLDFSWTSLMAPESGCCDVLELQWAWSASLLCPCGGSGSQARASGVLGTQLHLCPLPGCCQALLQDSSEGQRALQGCPGPPLLHLSQIRGPGGLRPGLPATLCSWYCSWFQGWGIVGCVLTPQALSPAHQTGLTTCTLAGTVMCKLRPAESGGTSKSPIRREERLEVHSHTCYSFYQPYSPIIRSVSCSWRGDL